MTRPGRARRLEPAWSNEAGDFVTGLAQAFPGGPLAVGTAAGDLLLLDPGTGREVARRAAHRGGLTALAWSPDGTWLVTAGRDAQVRRWSADGTACGALTAGAPWVERLAWSPLGATLAVAAGREVLLLEPDLSLRVRSGPRPSTVSGLAWSREPEELWSSELGGLRCWDPATGRERAALSCPGSLLGVAVTADAGRLASPGQDTTVRVFHRPSGAGQTLQGARAKPTALAWSEDGLLAHGGSEQVLVWSFEPGADGEGAAPRATARALAFHQARVGAVAFAPGGGGRLASGAADGSLAVWSLDAAGRPVAHALLAAAASQLTWAPSGAGLYAASARGQTLALDLRSDAAV